MEAGRRTASQKRLAPNQRVSGAVGDFVEGGPTKRHWRERWFGHVLQAVGERRYLVRFDNGQEKELPSNVLKVESAAASIPPDMPLPDRQHIRDVWAIIEANANIQESTEDEDLPVLRPEEEDAEAAEEEVNGGEAEEDNNGEDPNGRMPGQIPTAAAAAASVKDYHSIKKAAKEKIAALVGTEVSVATKKLGHWSGQW
jgi:hypothetical protein